MTGVFKGEAEPIAINPILRGVDLAVDRLVRRDCFTERTLAVLDELRWEIIATDEKEPYPPAPSRTGENP